ncbi:MAG: sugar-transfer associated ATP-grasp domain-containing protein [Pseudomonadota bacterium]
MRLTLYRRRMAFHNRMLYAALHNKISQKLWLDKVCPVSSPPMTHYVAGKKLIKLGSNEPEFGARSDVFSLIESGAGHFIKPADAGKGVGAYHVSRAPEGFRVNNMILGGSELKAWIRDLPRIFTISRVIEQSAFTRSIFPDAVSTVRVLTATSFVDYRVVVLGSVLKCASSRSAPTDNFKAGRGGAVAPIEMDTGIIGQCVSFDKTKSDRVLSDCHLETGVRVAGETLPHWESLFSTITALSAVLPSPGVAGWDVALRNDGITIVEINTLPGIDSVQSATSLLDTEAKRNILSELRMI